MSRCGREMCQHWTGDGCACSLLAFEGTMCAECGQFVTRQPALSEYPDADVRIWCGPDCRDNAGESREQQLHG